jgi:hypothetical protein
MLAQRRIHFTMDHRGKHDKASFIVRDKNRQGLGYFYFRPARGGKPTHQGRGAADGCELPQPLWSEPYMGLSRASPATLVDSLGAGIVPEQELSQPAHALTRAGQT